MNWFKSLGRTVDVRNRVGAFRSKAKTKVRRSMCSLDVAGLLTSIQLVLRSCNKGIVIASLILSSAGLSADVLVSNIDKGTTTHKGSLSSNDYAQGFRTGANSDGYSLTSVEVRFDSTAPTGITVSLATGTRTALTDVVTLTNPTSLSGGINIFTAPSGTTLSANTDYYIVLDADSGSQTYTTDTGEDSGGKTDWNIANVAWVGTKGGTFFFETGHVAQIRVNGTAATANSPASGAPTISGFPQVGQMLAAATTGISDSDGITGATYSYQWIRVDGTNETNIASATSSSYTLATADSGKTIKVKVAFADDAGNNEELTSTATGTVVAKAPACSTGNAWCATLTVGASTKGGIGAGNGYCSSVTNACTASYGSLSDTDFTLDDTTYNVKSVRWGTGGTRGNKLHLTLDSDFSSSDRNRLTLNVDSNALALSDASTTKPVRPVANNYNWSSPTAVRSYDVGRKVTVDLTRALLVPTVTIAAVTSPVTEGTAAEFTVTSDPAPSADLTVKLSVSDAASSDFIAMGDEGDKEVTITSDTASVTHSIDTVQDTIEEASGSVTVTISTDDAYTVGTNNSASVTVDDNDGSAPSISSLAISSSSGTDKTYAIGDTITFKATFDENVTVTTAGDPVVTGPRLPFTIGSTEKHAVYASGSGSAELLFSYQVVENDNDGDGVTVAANDLELNGGTIKDAVDKVATLTHAAVAASADHKVDGIRPRINTSASRFINVISSARASSTYAIGEHIEIRLIFSEAVTATVAGDPPAGPAIGIRIGSATRNAIFNRIGSATELIFRYTVQAGDVDTDGIHVRANSVSLGGGSINDGAGNAATSAGLAHFQYGASAHRVDGVRPAFSSATVNGTALSVTFSEALNASGSTKPASSVFTVTATKDETDRTINGSTSAVTISGSTVTATLSSAVTHEDSIKVAYTVPSANSFTDVLGNAAVAFSDKAVTNSTNTPPTFTSPPSSLDVKENSADETEVGTVAATDADDDMLTYSLDSTTDGSFDIGSDGVIKVQSGATLDHEAKSSFATTVTVNDGTVDATHSLIINVTDELEPPDAPEAPTVTGSTDSTTSIDVSWTAPSVTGKPAITDYDVQYKKASETNWVAHTFDSTDTSTTISSLTENTSYNVQVKATNNEGSSGWSTAGTGKTGLSLRVSISGGSDVTEGTAAQFTVTASTMPAEALTVKLMVSDATGSDFVAETDEGSKTVTIATTGTTATYSVTTQGDSTHEPNGLITVTVETGDDYSVGSPSSATVTVKDDDNVSPTGSVTITGTVTQGQTLTADTSAVADGDGLGTLSYQWIRGSTDITGATSSTYTLVQADVGETIKVKVSWTDDGGTSESLTSNPTTAVANINGSVTITGTVTQGQTLTADTSNVSDPDGPTTLSFTYQWIRGGTNISGATSSTYQLVQADVGQTIMVTVSWTDAGSNAESLTSKATSTVANINDDPIGSVSITGSLAKGETLTADTSGISDPDGPASLTFSYQWIRGSTNISGATSSTYTLAEADVGQTIKVTVSWTDAGNTAESLTSDATAAVADVDETSPTISSINISSTPSADTNSDNTADTYVIGDKITVDFTFNEPVTYSGSGNRLRMRLDLGADDSDYQNSGKVLRSPTITGSTLRFSYTVVEGDLDADGLWVQTNTPTSDIVLFGPDVNLLTDAANNIASVTFSDLATSGDTKHKVDGVRPAFASATVNGSALAVTFSKTLDVSGATKPASSIFTVTATKSGTDRTVNGSSTAVTIDGKVVSATLDSAVAHDETVKVDYSAPSANPLEDLVGNDVSDFDDEDVTNNTPSPSNPSITISGGAAVTEGTAAQFTVTASPAPASNVTVNLSVSDASGSDFVASGNEGDNKTVTINANTTSATYSVATVNDTVDEANGDVTVTVKTGSGYTVGSTSSATVTVNDDDDPAVTISGGSAVTEGTAAQFTVTIATAPSANLTINLTVSDFSSSDFIAATDEGSKSVTIMANNTSATYSVTTQSDTTDEASGDITVALAAGAGYQIGSPNSATVTVNDDDNPTITISSGSAVTEGTAAQFTVTSSTAPASDLTVNLSVSDASGSDFIASTNEGNKTVTISTGNTSATYSVPTVNDTTDEASGSITVALASGNGYTLGSSNSATVTVNDDDDPVVTISGGSAVTEGTAAEFTVTISTAPTSDLNVELSVSEASGSDFVASGDEGNKTVTIKASKTTATYSVATQADTTDEPNGGVTVTVSTGSGYTVGSANSATVTVNDDDDEGPTITIAAGTSPVTEGTAATFTITASETPMADLMVNLTVADVAGSDFIASGAEGSKTVTITASTTSATYSVATQSDTVDEASGAVTVTVAAGTGYNVGSSNSASVTVNDDDLPAITVSGGDAVTEGTAAEFTVTASTAPTSNLTVNLTVADATNSDFIASGDEGSKMVSITADSTSATYSVNTTADTTDEPNGTISVTVASGTGYTVGSPSSGTVTVNDDDATANRAPVFTSQPATASINENSAADTTVVTITATDPEGDTITYSLDSTSDEIFDIDSGDGEITVQANDSLNHEANASITATVTATDTNNNAATHDVVITIIDRNEPPDAPGAPSVSATSGSSTSIDVSWTAPSTTGKPDINGYDVQYKKSSETNWTAHSFTGTGTTTTIASLDANTTYNVQIKAKNAEGSSDWSSTGSASTSNTTPTFTSQPSTATINENSVAGTTVVTVLATDPDAGDSVTHSLDTTADDLFNIDGSTGKITVKANDSLDHEARSSITATVTATDSQNASATHDVTITIADRLEPPAAPGKPSVSGASTTSINVTWTAPTNTGKPAITDYDVRFKESSATEWSDHEFESASTSTTISSLSPAVSYDVQIMATNAEGDSAWSATGSGKTNNTAPTFSSPPTSLSVKENSADGTDVGTVAATDADGHTLTYSLDTTTAGSFVIDSDGLIEVKSGADLDHESKSSFSATVTVNDGTVDVTHALMINVTDALEPPGVPTGVTVSATAGSTTSIDVSWTAPSTTGIPAISDYDVQHRVSGVQAWTDSEIDTTSTSATIGSLLAGTTYEVQVRAHNAEGSGDFSATGSGDTNNTPPSFSSPPSTLSVNENSAGATDVGTVSATDDDGHTLSYALDTTTAGSFNINSSGEITVKSGASLDHEAKSSFSTTVTVSDGRSNGSVTHSLMINIADVLEPPAAPGAPTVSATSGSTTSIDVSWTAPSTTGKPSISDYDVQYRVSGEDDWTDAEYDSTAVSTAIGSLLAGTTYEVQVQAHNNEGASGWSLTGSGDTNNTPPTFTSPPSSLSVNENSAGNSDVGTVAATDADGHTLTYSLDTTTDGSFNISSSGAITVQSGADLDHEAKSSFSTTVTVADGRSDGTVSHSLIINIVDVLEPPGTPPGTPGVTSTSTTSITVTWTAPNMTGKPAISDYDVRQRVQGTTTWTDAGVNTTSTSATIANLLAGTTYEVQVQAHNNEGSSNWSATGSGDTLNTAPVFTSTPASLSIDENSATNTAAGTVAATDADGHTLTYSLNSAADAVFDINSSGTIALQSGASLDYEATTSYPTTVTVTDDRVNVSHSFTINVGDEDEPPDTPAVPTVTSEEDSTTSVTVAWVAPDVTGRPPITGYSVRYYRGATDPIFESAWIGSSVVGGYVHEGTDTTATITGLFAGSPYRIQIAAINDEGTSSWSASGSGSTNVAGNSAPLFTSPPSAVTIDENADEGTTVATVTATDADDDDVTYSLDETSDAFFDISAAGVITVQTGATIDHEATASITVTVIANDGSVNATHDLTVNVNDLDEPPDAPRAPSLENASGFSVTVSWTAPDTTGRPPLTDFDIRYYQGSSDPANETDWIEPDEMGGHDHVGTNTTTTIIGLASDTSYRVQVTAKNDEGSSDWSAGGNAATTELTAPAISRIALISIPPVDQNQTYLPGDTVRARVSFDAPVDLVGSPVLTMQLDRAEDTRVLVLDNTSALTSTTALEFTYDVVAGDQSTFGIAFGDDPLTLPVGTTIRAAGSPTVNAVLISDAIPSDSNHRVDGVPPMLVEADPIRLSSSSGIDGVYAIGDHIEITAEFTEPVMIEGTNGQAPASNGRTRAFSGMLGPRVAFRLGGETKFAVYHRTDGVLVVFRYTIVEGDMNAESIIIEEDALQLNGGTVTDTRGNTSEPTGLVSASVIVPTGHEVDGTPPQFVTSTVKETTLRVEFTESLNATAEVKPPGSVFTLVVTDAEGGTRTVSGSNEAIQINGELVTVTLASEILHGETATVSYAVLEASPITDVPGNRASGFSGEVVRNTTSATGVNTVPVFEDPPVSLEIAENSGRGTTVGMVTAIDADGDSLIYRLDGATDTVFDIDRNGIISIQRGATVDYERTAQYEASVTVDDGLDEITHRLTIIVVDIDEPPVAPGAPEVTIASATSLTVNWTAADDVGKPPITDYDVRYRLSDATDWMDAEFNGIEVTLTLENLSEEVEYAVQVRATNAEGTSDWSASGVGTPIDPAKNGPPIFSSPADSLSVAENSPAGTVVGLLPAGDPEGDRLTFRLDSVSDTLFDIDNRGRIRVQVGADMDHEAMPTVQVVVTVTDNINEVTHELTINIMDVDEPPDAPSRIMVEAESDTRLIVNWVAPDDSTKPPITVYDVQYRVEGELGWSSTTFEGAGSSAAIDDLMPSTTYDVRLRANNDEGASDWSSIGTATTNDENKAPTFTAPPASLSISENSVDSVMIGTVAATDAENDPLSYSLDDASAEMFDIDSDGVITLKSDASLDHEAANSFAVTVSVTDGRTVATYTLTILVTDEDEPPATPEAPNVRSKSTTSLAVNWVTPDETGIPLITDYDVRYRVAETTDWIDFEIDGVETRTTIENLVAVTRYEVQVRATNDEGSSEWSESGTAETGNSAPSFTSPPRSLNVDENSEGGTVIGSVAATDADGQSLTYTLDSSSIALFDISESGVITVQSDADLNHEGTSRYRVTVTVSDGREEASHDVSIFIDDVDEPPSAPSTPSVIGISTSSVTVTWTEPDMTGKPSISDYDVQQRVSGTSDWAHADITTTSTSATLSNLASGTTYEVQVRAHNDEGSSAWSETGSGDTLNSVPTFMSPPSALSVAENSAGGTTVGSVVATDAEDDPLVYSLDDVSDVAFDIDNEGVITVQSDVTLDHETTSRFETTVSVSDGQESASHGLTIYVTDVREAPGKPAAPTLTTPATNPRSSLAVSWEPPSNTGPAINDYDVQYRNAGQASWSNAVFDGSSTSTTLTGLTSGVTYDVRVRASNEEGVGEWSDPASHAVLGLTAMDASPIAEAWLARFGRTVTDEVNEAITTRRNTSISAAQNDVAVAGHTLWLTNGHDQFNGHYHGVDIDSTNPQPVEMSMSAPHESGVFDAIAASQPAGYSPNVLIPDLLSTSSFNLTASPAGSGRGVAAFWGRGGITRFDGREGDLTLEGTVKTGFLAADWSAGGESNSDSGQWMLGLLLGHAQGVGEFRNASDSGDLETRLTGLFPYGSIALSDRLSIWSVVGQGSGELTFMPDGFTPLTTDISLTTGSFGLRRDVSQRSTAEGFAVALKGDARFTQSSSDAASNNAVALAAVDTSSWLTRLGIEGTRHVMFGDGSTLTPRIEIALRFDGGDAETGYGADIGGGFSFTDASQAARFDIKGRGLLTHEESDFREWGMSASFIWDPQPENDRGFSFSLTQSLGATPNVGMDALWSQGTLNRYGASARRDRSTLIDQNFDVARVIKGEISYALPAFRSGVLNTPYVGIGVSDIGRDWRLGWRMMKGGMNRGDMTFNLDAVHREFNRRGIPIDVGVMLRGSLLF